MSNTNQSKEEGSVSGGAALVLSDEQKRAIVTRVLIDEMDIEYGIRIVNHTLEALAALSSQSEADESAREPEGMRAAFMAWVEDQGCDTDGAWSAWQGCWELLSSQSEAR